MKPQYIDKATLVAEIERIKNEECPTDTYEGRCKLLWLEQFLSFLDTLEVKDVDLEEEMDKEWNKCEPTDEGMGLEIASIEHEQFDNIAKHFYELGQINTRKEIEL